MRRPAFRQQKRETSQNLTTAIATLCTVIAVLPAFALGAAGVLLRSELDVSHGGLGSTIGIFFAMSAVVSVPGGRISQRFGPRAGLAAGLLLSGLGCLAIAAIARDLNSLVLAAAAAGAGNGIMQPAANVALARGVRKSRALFFGMKQSAIPMATLLAGLIVPAASATVGWRPVFVMVGLLAWFTVPLLPSNSTGPPSAPAVGSSGRLQPATLALTAVGAAIGTAAASAMGSFLIESHAANGLSVRSAGIVLAAGSLGGLVTRVGVGWLADRRGERHLPVVARMLFAGAAGYLLLAVGTSVWMLVLGTLAAYMLGWGWNGLLNFAVIDASPLNQGTATGVMQTGATAGAGIGPFIFGFTVMNHSFTMAWLLTAAAGCVAACFVYGAHRHGTAAASAPHTLPDGSNLDDPTA